MPDIAVAIDCQIGSSAANIYDYRTHLSFGFGKYNLGGS